MAAELKPSVNLFSLLDRNDPGDRLVADLGSADGKQEVPVAKHKKTATPAANHTKDLLGQAYPSARDYVIRKQRLERQARASAKAEAEAMVKAKANNGASGDDKSVGASADSSKAHDGAKLGKYYNNNNNSSSNNNNNNNNKGAYRNQQFGMSGKFGMPKRQQPGMSMNKAAPAEGAEAPQALQKASPPPPPNLYDINEFPSLK